MSTGNRLEDVGEALQMVRLLADIGWMDMSQSANGRRLSLCRRLSRDGVTEPVLRMLWAYAEACGDDQMRLFSYWLKSPARTLTKIDEMRSKSAWAAKTVAKQHEAKPPIEGVIHQLARKMQA